MGSSVPVPKPVGTKDVVGNSVGRGLGALVGLADGGGKLGEGVGSFVNSSLVPNDVGVNDSLGADVGSNVGEYL